MNQFFYRSVLWFDQGEDYPLAISYEITSDSKVCRTVLMAKSGRLEWDSILEYSVGELTLGDGSLVEGDFPSDQDLINDGATTWRHMVAGEFDVLWSVARAKGVRGVNRF